MWNDAQRHLYYVAVFTENEDRKVRLKVEIKPVSPSAVSADNVGDIRSLVKGLQISATPTVLRPCCHVAVLS